MDANSPQTNEMVNNEEGGINERLSSSPSSGFITVDLQESENAENFIGETQRRVHQREIAHKKETKRSRKVSRETSSLIGKSNETPSSAGNQSSSSSITSNSQELPPSDLSPTTRLNGTRSDSLDHLEVVTSLPMNRPSATSPSPASFQQFKPSISSSIFSFIMTVAFICILWLVVFMVFGYRGHAIAGVFIGLFLVGLLLNTCFLKLYFRFKMFLGLSAAFTAAERQAAAVQRRRQMQEQLVSEKANEKPPSYDTAMESPPPYNFLQYYKQRKSPASVTSSSSSTSMYRKGHNCPFCKSEVRIFGICVSCKNNLSRK